MCLRFEAHTRRDRQIAPYADVILHVQRHLRVVVGDVRFADAPCVAARPARLEHVDAFERVCAEVVVRFVRSERVEVDGRSHTNRMHPAHVVEVCRKVHVARVTAARFLRAAECLRVEDAHGRFFNGGLPQGIAPPDVEARIDEEAAAERTDLLRAERVVGVLRDERAFGLVVPADTLVLVHEVAAVEAEPQRLITRGGPIELRSQT